MRHETPAPRASGVWAARTPPPSRGVFSYPRPPAASTAEPQPEPRRPRNRRAGAAVVLLIVAVGLVGWLPGVLADPPDCDLPPQVLLHSADRIGTFNLRTGAFEVLVRRWEHGELFDIGVDPDGEAFVITAERRVFHLDLDTGAERLVGVLQPPPEMPTINPNMLAFDRFGFAYAVSDGGDVLYRYRVDAARPGDAADAVGADAVGADAVGAGDLSTRDDPGTDDPDTRDVDTDVVDDPPPPVIDVEVVAAGLRAAGAPAGTSAGDVFFLGGDAYIAWRAGSGPEARDKLLRLGMEIVQGEDGQARYLWDRSVADLGFLSDGPIRAWGMAVADGRIMVADNVSEPPRLRWLEQLPTEPDPDRIIALSDGVEFLEFGHVSWWDGAGLWGMGGVGEAVVDYCLHLGAFTAKPVQTATSTSPALLPASLARPPAPGEQVILIDGEVQAEQAFPDDLLIDRVEVVGPGFSAAFASEAFVPDALIPAALAPGVSVPEASVLEASMLEASVLEASDDALSVPASFVAEGVAAEVDGIDGDARLLLAASEAAADAVADTPAGGQGSLRVVRGQGLAVDLDGFAPDSLARLWLTSQQEPVGSILLGPDGTVETTLVEVPADAPACADVLQAVGSLPTGSEAQLAVGVWVEAQTYPFADTDQQATHGHAIGCLADLGVVDGRGDGTFDAGATTTRGQAATMLARLLDLAPVDAPFVDTDGDVHARAIGALAQADIVQGFRDDTFRPGEPVTRGQAAVMLAAAAGLDPMPEVAIPMLDPDGHRYAGAIGALLDVEVVRGFPDGTFRPDLPVERAQFATMLVRMRPLLGLQD